MRRTPTRLAIARSLGVLAGWASRVTKRGDGAALPGSVMMSLVPDALAQLSVDRSITLVSGTNGKLTTTAMIVAALDRPVATNAIGANLTSGVVTALAASPHATAVLEVDELYLPSIARETNADLVIALNLTRDQLDRMGEVSMVARAWHEAFATCGTHVVANTTDPHVVAAVGDAPVTWVDPGWSWTDDSVVCPACTALLARTDGRWFCSCGLRQPDADYCVCGSLLTLPDGTTIELDVSLPGAVNIGNTAFAVAAAAHHGVAAADAVERIARLQDVQGRYATIVVGGRLALLLLAKNPAGWAATLPMLRPDDAVLISVTAQIFDGADTSWLWDVPFEELAGRVVGAHGDSRHDLAVRLEVAGADPRVDADMDALVRQLPSAPRLVVVATYTSFTELRKRR